MNNSIQLNTRLSGIDAGRGIAALLVVLFHATVTMADAKYFAAEPLNGVFKFGYAGVDFFFVLSGFIILFLHHGDIGRKKAIRSYAEKRFLRVYPVYWLVSAFLILMLALAPSTNGFPQIDHGVKSLLLIPEENLTPIVNVAWTLIHEVFFYLLFGILIYWTRAGLLLMAAWLLGVLAHAALNLELNYLLKFVFHFHNLEFFLGMLVAILCMSEREPYHPKLLLRAGITLFCASGLLDILTQHQLSENLYTLCYAITSAAIIYGLVTSELANQLTAPAWLQFIGAGSYSVYLVHYLAISFIVKLELATGMQHLLPLWLNWLIMVGAALCIGLFFHTHVERPLLRTSRRVLSPKHVPA